jgi:chemotaxis response regulator CheB
LVVAVGSGTGGIGALIRFIAGLPKGIAASTLVIQHLMDSTLDAFVEYVRRFSSVPVRRAENNTPLEPGTCQIACSDHYVNVESGEGAGPPRLRVGVRPALFQSTQTINWAFFSVAETCAQRAVAVILAGQSEDGSKGAAEIRRMGGGCIVQDPETCIAPDMPRAAIALNVAEAVVPESEVGAALVRWLGERSRRLTAAPSA